MQMFWVLLVLMFTSVNGKITGQFQFYNVKYAFKLLIAI
mgnify:CR=1 FL=1